MFNFDGSFLKNSNYIWITGEHPEQTENNLT